MNVAGFDLATNSGICVHTDAGFRAYSFRPKTKRPSWLAPMEIDATYEAQIKEPFRDHVRELLVSEGIEHVAFEKPRTRDFNRTKTVAADTGSEWAGKAFRKVQERGSSNLAMIRAMVLCSELCGVCQRLNVPVVAVPADDWRQAFLGFSRVPKSITGGDAVRRRWMKEQTILQCTRAGISVPNDDAGDAVGVTWWLLGHLKLARLSRPGELRLEGAA